MPGSNNHGDGCDAGLRLLLQLDEQRRASHRHLPTGGVTGRGRHLVVTRVAVAVDDPSLRGAVRYAVMVAGYALGGGYVTAGGACKDVE